MFSAFYSSILRNTFFYEQEVPFSYGFCSSYFCTLFVLGNSSYCCTFNYIGDSLSRRENAITFCFGYLSFPMVFYIFYSSNRRNVYFLADEPFQLKQRKLPSLTSIWFVSEQHCQKQREAKDGSVVSKNPWIVSRGFPKISFILVYLL